MARKKKQRTIEQAKSAGLSCHMCNDVWNRQYAIFYGDIKLSHPADFAFCAREAWRLFLQREPE